MRVAIVTLDKLNIASLYDAPEPSQSSYGGEWGSPQVTIHLEVPEGLDPRCLMAVRDDSGEITLVQDPSKVQAKLESAWTSLRAQRNQLLTASDWTQGNDSPLSTESKSAWAAYRAALRDLPDVTTDPLTVEWPSVPSP